MRGVGEGMWGWGWSEVLWGGKSVGRGKLGVGEGMWALLGLWGNFWGRVWGRFWGHF